MDPPDSAAKRISYYCTLDMIQAGRNNPLEERTCEQLTSGRTTLTEHCRSTGPATEHRTRDGAQDPRRKEMMVILDVFANDLRNGDRIDINDYLFGDIILITSFMALPNSRLADIVSTFDNIHRTESHRFLAVKEFYLLKWEFSETQRTNGHLTSDPTPPSVVTIKPLSRRDAEDFDAMPQPFRRFNGDKGKALAVPGGMRLHGIYRNFGSGPQKQETSGPTQPPSQPAHDSEQNPSYISHCPGQAVRHRFVSGIKAHHVTYLAPSPQRDRISELLSRENPTLLNGSATGLPTSHVVDLVPQ
uniref:Uncharacterized protein n=1 Tax=Caenorhabditis japonica TaxID=281687 RepID=A0A8R1IA54_CAEJA